MRLLRELDVKNKRVLLRADFNVSIEGGEVQDDFRIRASLPTIQYLLDHGAKVLVMSHLGRPKGPDPSLSLHPVADHLSKLLERRILFFANYERARHALDDMEGGEIALYENIRFDSREEELSEEFARELAALCDVYINDAFGVSHRKHTSVYLLPKLVRDSAAGLLLEKEITTFNEIRTTATRPLAFIMGGAKVETKIKLLAELMGHIDAVCLGGLIANSFLDAKGIAIGSSMKGENFEKYLDKVELTDSKIHLPIDMVVSTDPTGKKPSRITAAADIAQDEMILDIGPDTVTLFSNVIKKAGTVFWNGPMGLFEVDEFAKGTFALAHALKDTKARVVVGGGDVMRALREVHGDEHVYYQSTGGGAMLEYLAEGTLPGIEALR